MEKQREWIFLWHKDHISLNDWYSSTHWTKRQQAKKKFSLIFLEMLMKYKPFTVDKYELELKFNSRLDTSNTIPMIKLFEDFLVKRRIIKDDSKEYARRIVLEPSDELPKQTYKLTLKELKNETIIL